MLSATAALHGEYVYVTEERCRGDESATKHRQENTVTGAAQHVTETPP